MIYCRYIAVVGSNRRCAGIARQVPAIILPHLTAAERRAYRVAGNNIALASGWHFDLLRQEVEFLLDDEFEIDVDGIGLRRVNSTSFLATRNR